jgi:urease accessory protein
VTATLAGATGVRGSLHALFSSSAADIEARPPLELRGPFVRDGAAPSYYLNNVTTGVFAGDEYDVALRAEAGARATVTSPAATKVHAMPAGSALSRLTLEALPGSDLRYLPQPAILQCDSDYAQHTEIVAHEDARVAFADTVVLGRLAAGERLAFRRFSSRLRIRGRAVDRPFYEGRYTLEPTAAGCDLEAALAAYGVLITVIVLGRDAEPLLDLAPDLPSGEACYAGIDRLPGDRGVILRALAASSSWADVLLDRLGLT